MSTSQSGLSSTTLIQKVEHFCAYQERCLWEVEMKLRFWKVPEQQIPGILKQMKDSHYIDDERFARMFVRGKFHVNKWGRIKITQELRRRNIPEPIIRQALHEIDEDEYSNMLKTLILAKKNEMTKRINLMIREKIITFVTGKGFEHYLADKILIELEKNHDHT